MQKPDNLTALVGKYYPSLQSAAPELSQFEQISTLLTRPTRSNELLKIEQLEMLEAELRNQQILTPSGEATVRLSQVAAIERNVLRWRAKRWGIASVRLELLVDVPRYLVRTALELLAALHEGENVYLDREARRHPWRSALTSEEHYRSELAYLEQLALYLNGNFDRSETKYQKGLNLILTVLSAPELEPQGVLEEAIQIVLPLSAKEIFSLLREVRALAYGELG